VLKNNGIRYIMEKMPSGGKAMCKSNVYSNPKNLNCEICGKNLFDNPGMSMINIIQDMETQKIVAVKPCCKGKCDSSISTQKNEISGWKDLSDFTNPYLYMKHIMSVMNCMNEDEGFANQKAFEDYKDLLLKVYPYVTRNLTDKEKQAVIFDNAMPF
jgi:hypothetical protein